MLPRAGRCYPRSMPGVGIPELLIVFAVLLLLFGAKRLPEMGRSIGHGMREFKDAVTGKVELEETKAPPQAAAPPAAPPVAAPPVAAPPAAAPAEPPAAPAPPGETEQVSS